VLAAQVAAIRDCVDAAEGADLLWRTGDVLARLSALVVELGRRCQAPELDEQCAAAVAAEAEVSTALDALAFLQSQRHDLARQMADCVITALARLAADQDSAAGNRISPEDLAAMYVCEAQRRTHEAVARQFKMETAGYERPAGIAGHTQPGDGA
jgi:hypothetical protein